MEKYQIQNFYFNDVHIRAHYQLAKLPCTMPKHDCPPIPSPPLACTHIAPVLLGMSMLELPDLWSGPVFSNTELFTEPLYLDFVCCCLPKFKVNTLQTVTATLALCACACAYASSNHARANKACCAWA